MEKHLIIFFLQLTLILVSARLLGRLAERIGQSRVIGELMAGVALGPSGLGLAFPEVQRLVFHGPAAESLYLVGQIGLVFLMFQLGAEIDFSAVAQRRNRRIAGTVAAAGLVVPFALGALVAWTSWLSLAPDIAPLGYVLFCGVALAITAVPVLGRILVDLDLVRSYVGGIAITAAAITDVAGWFLLAAVVSIVAAGFEASALALQLGLFVAYVLVCWRFVPPLIGRLAARVPPHGADALPLASTLLPAVLVSGLMALLFGLHVAFGGFLAGLLVRGQPAIGERWKHSGGAFVNALLVPVFFVHAGLQMDLAAIGAWPYLPWLALFLAAAVLGKFGGCYLAARWSGLNVSQARAVGILMNTRGLMELIVLAIGYQRGVITGAVYTMLVLVAVVTTVMTVPLLRRWAPSLAAPLTAREVR